MKRNLRDVARCGLRVFLLSCLASSAVLLGLAYADPAPTPPEPSGLAQLDPVTGAAIPTGETSPGNRVRFQGVVSTTDGTRARMQVQVLDRAETWEVTAPNGEGFSPFLPSGSTAQVDLSFVGENAFQWRARTCSAGGDVSDWAEFGGPGGTDFVHFYAAHPAPEAPAGLAQLDALTGAPIPLGASTPSNHVRFQAAVSSLDGTSVRLEVQDMDISDTWEAVGTAYAGVSGFVASGSSAHVDLTFVGDNANQWRARTCSTTGEVSDWVEFGDNGLHDTDFVHYEVAEPPFPLGLSCLSEDGDIEIFRDEFTGAAIDPAKWTLSTNSDGAGATLEEGRLVVNGGTTDGGGAAFRSVPLTAPGASALRLQTKARTDGRTATLLVGYLGSAEAMSFVVSREPGMTGVVQAELLHIGISREFVDLPAVDPTKWHDYVIVLQSGAVGFYLDGALVAAFPIATVPDAAIQVQFDQSSQGTNQDLAAEYVELTSTPAAAAPIWTTLIDEHFDGPALPMPWAFGGSGGSFSFANGNLYLHSGTSGGGRVETTGQCSGEPGAPLRLAARARMSAIDAQFFLGFARDGVGSAAFLFDQWEHTLAIGIGPILTPVPDIDCALWHEYVIEFDGASAKFFVDGVLVGTRSELGLAGVEMVIRLDQISIGTDRVSGVDCVSLTKRNTSAHSKIVFMTDRDGHNELYKMDPDGSDQVRLTDTTVLSPRSPRISPDGRHILCTAGARGSGHVFLMNADGSDYHEILTNIDGKDVDAVAWSPDGTKVCLARGGLWIYTLAANGDGVDGWLLTSASSEGPDWSPDGHTMIYGYYSIHSVSVDEPHTSGLGVIVGGHVQYARWSPDNLHIAFEHDVPGGEIYVMNADGSDLHIAHSGGEYPEKAAWMSADRLLFDTEIDGNRDIYAVNADGSGLTRVTTNGSNEFYAEYGTLLEVTASDWSTPPTTGIAPLGTPGSDDEPPIGDGGTGTGGGGTGTGGGGTGTGGGGTGTGGGGTEAGAPFPPRFLRQFTPGDGVVGVGETVHSVRIGTMATLWSATEGELLRLEIEVRRAEGPFAGDYAEAFAGAPSEAASEAVPSGSIATCTVGTAPAMSLRWRARTVNVDGVASAWVEFGGNASEAGDFLVDPSAPVGGSAPLAPTLLTQTEDGSPFELAPGGTVTTHWIQIHASVLDIDLGDHVRLDVEVRRAAGMFPGDEILEWRGDPTDMGAFFERSATALVRIPLPDKSSWRWRCRAVDEAGHSSDWVEFGGNGDEPDFGVDFGVPGTGPVGGGDPPPPAGNLPPTEPTDIVQWARTLGEAVPVGAETADESIDFKGVISDPDAGQLVRLELELRRAAGPYAGDSDEVFTGEPTHYGSFAASGVERAVTVALPAGSSWKWRIRTADEAEARSAWVEFGGNGESEVDLRRALDGSPAIPGIGGTPDQVDGDSDASIPLGSSTRTTDVIIRGTVTSDDPAEPLMLEVQLAVSGTLPAYGGGYDGGGASGDGPSPGGDGGGGHDHGGDDGDSGGSGSTEMDGVADGTDVDDPRFAGATSLFSEEVTSGTVASVHCGGLVSPNTYIWRARTVGAGGRVTAWVVVDGGTATSYAFAIDHRPPPAPGYDGGGPGSGPPPAPVNHAPVADAGADIFAEASSAAGSSVTLSGAGSSDPDGDALTWTWTGDFGTVVGATPTVTLGLGAHVVTLTVTDSHGESATDTMLVGVIDSIAPVFGALTASPDVLSPPNHKLIAVTLSGSATDAVDAAPTFVILSVSSNEATSGLGGGDTPIDWEITGAMTLKLRAERSGKGSGRIYTITVKATDASGNSSVKAVTVRVPKGE